MSKVTVFPITLLLILLFVQGSILAQERASIEDKLISLTFKSLVKAFVAANDIDKLKKANIDKLNKMDEDKFRKRYTKVFEVIKELPYKFKASYQITEQMTRQQAVKNLESLDKKKIYEAVDSIPDTIIATQFKQYLNQKKQEVQKSGLVEQINKFWSKVTEKINLATPASNSYHP